MNTTVKYDPEWFGEPGLWPRFKGYQDDEGGKEIIVTLGDNEIVLARNSTEVYDLYRFVKKTLEL